MEFTPIDFVLIGVMAALGGWGMWRGIAGELAAVAWIVAALVVGYLAYSPMCGVVETFMAAGRTSGNGAGLAAVGVTVFVALVVALLVRFAVRKFVSFLLPQPWNAILGGLVGVLKGAVLVAVLTAVGLVQTGPLSEGFFASRSSIVKLLANAADSYKSAAEGVDSSQPDAAEAE